MRIAIVLLMLPGLQGALTAQERLTLTRTLELAGATSPELASARAGARAAGAWARQTGAFPNPNLVFGRERASGPDGVNGQVTIHLEQRLELTGVRTAERSAASARARAADADLSRTAQLLNARVTKSFVHLVSARRRAALSDRLRQLTDSAATIVSRQFEVGDASGFDRRRLELEAARYTAAMIAARFEADSAATDLAALIGRPGSELEVVDILPPEGPIASIDSLLSGLPTRADLQASELTVTAAAAEATARSRDWIPTPTMSAGYKREESAGRPGRFTGFVAGLAFPLPLWDRRSEATASRLALADRARADRDRLHRDAATEVRRLASGLRALIEQRRVLGSRLGPDADVALRAIAVAFAEGELPVAQWLDAVRAYYEAQAALVDLDAAIAGRHADLAAATGPTEIGGVR